MKRTKIKKRRRILMVVSSRSQSSSYSSLDDTRHRIVYEEADWKIMAWRPRDYASRAPAAAP
jgi:hypothetical protein